MESALIAASAAPKVFDRLISDLSRGEVLLLLLLRRRLLELLVAVLGKAHLL